MSREEEGTAMIDVVVTPAGRGKYRYTARDGTGATVDGISGLSATPLLAAARKALAAGTPASAGLSMRHEGSAIVSFRTTVGIAAGLTVEETSSGPRFRSFREFWQDEANR